MHMLCLIFKTSFPKGESALATATVTYLEIIYLHLLLNILFLIREVSLANKKTLGKKSVIPAEMLSNLYDKMVGFTNLFVYD